MMHSNDNSHEKVGTSSAEQSPGEESLENTPFLPSSSLSQTERVREVISADDEYNNGGAGALRSRRRGAPPMVNADNNVGHGKYYSQVATEDDSTISDQNKYDKLHGQGRGRKFFSSTASATGSIDSFSRNNYHHNGSITSLSGCVKEEEFYFDDTNDQSWTCSFGTDEGDGIWMVRNDPTGTLMAIIVWVLISYSGITVTLLAEAGHLSNILALIYLTVCALALASHAKTMFSDPGAIPQCAVPVDSAARRMEVHTMCSTCRSFKPPGSHHCRICNRCVSRMDHHCPWMNNCIGSANFKSFFLFLSYTWIGSAFALIIFGCNYFFCQEEKCEFSGVLVYLVRVMTALCVASLLFTTTMLSNAILGAMTGMGTIDRMKRSSQSSYDEADDAPLHLEDIFGIGNYATWLLPIDPVFADYDRVLGYSMPQRLLREGGESDSAC